MKIHAARRAGFARGIALLEVLICSFILATGIVAVLNMQTLAVGVTLNSGHLLQAEWLLNDILERIKANPSGYQVALATGADGHVHDYCETLTACSAAELAEHDLARWQQRLAERLPGGYGTIEPVALPAFPPAARPYRVRVHWQGSIHGHGPASSPVSSGIVVL